MTQDIDLISTCAEAFVHELRDYLGRRFHIAVRVRKVASGRGIDYAKFKNPATVIWLT